MLFLWWLQTFNSIWQTYVCLSNGQVISLMTSETSDSDPAAILRELGLKEYEAQCLVALTRMPQGSAKDISEIAAVPRTRVYDAVEQLQSYGLVDVQHSNPQQFRAIPVEEAVALLQRQFDQRFETLRGALDDLDPVGEETLDGGANVWSTSGTQAITRRATQFVDGAEEEIVFVIDGSGTELIPERLLDRLRTATERGVTVYVGALSATTYEEVQASIPDIEVFESELEWLQPQTEQEEEQIGRLLLVDREKLLLSSLSSQRSDSETAIWSDSVGNGLTIIGRRLLATGLDRQAEDLGSTEEDERDAKKREEKNEEVQTAETSEGDTEE